jgi:arginase
MTTYLIGCASGIAGADVHAGDGPKIVRQSQAMQALEKSGHVQWQHMLTPVATSMRKDENVRQMCVDLAKEVSDLVQAKKPFCVIGGDHSCAIGTWSGVYDALHSHGDLGFIWIDAHMDSHTPETSPSNNIHGMPLACLLGYGYPTLTSVLHDAPKIKPENLCLIGVRSYESGEAALLKRLNVKIYFMDEVEKRGFATVLAEAVAHVTKHTAVYGVTIDIDALDPQDAPGVDVPEEGGIRLVDLLAGLQHIVHDKKLIGTEVVEFDPVRDRDGITEKTMTDIITTLVTK